MLKDQMVRHGNWLFRWRSYLPIMLVPVALSVFQSAGWMSDLFGDPIEDGYDVFCLLIALTGLGVRVATIGFVPAGTSGRNTDGQKAMSLNTTGFYSLMRHPLYFANFLIFIAFVLLFKNLVFTLFAGVAYFLYYERIMLAEEQFLESQHGERYRTWANATPVFFPAFSGWISPALPFSWRSALRREFHGLFLIAAVFFLVEMMEAMVIDRQSLGEWMWEEPLWLGLLTGAGTVYLGVMLIKKRTDWLAVAGR